MKPSLPVWLQPFHGASLEELHTHVASLTERERECIWEKADCIAAAVILAEINGDKSGDIYNAWPGVGRARAIELAKLGRIWAPEQRDMRKPIIWYSALTSLVQEQNDLQFPRSIDKWEQLQDVAGTFYGVMSDKPIDAIYTEQAATINHVLEDMPGVSIQENEVHCLIRRGADGTATLLDENGVPLGKFNLKMILRRLEYDGELMVTIEPVSRVSVADAAPHGESQLQGEDR